jgi:hypothetical protein
MKRDRPLLYLSSANFLQNPRPQLYYVWSSPVIINQSCFDKEQYSSNEMRSSLVYGYIHLIAKSLSDSKWKNIEAKTEEGYGK